MVRNFLFPASEAGEFMFCYCYRDTYIYARNRSIEVKKIFILREKSS